MPDTDEWISILALSSLAYVSSCCSFFFVLGGLTLSMTSYAGRPRGLLGWSGFSYIGWCCCESSVVGICLHTHLCVMGLGHRGHGQIVVVCL